MIPSSLAGPAGRRLLGAVGLALLVSACAEVAALIGPVPGLSGPSDATEFWAPAYHRWLQG